VPTDLEELKSILDDFLGNLDVCTDRMQRSVDLFRSLATADPLEGDIAALDEVAWTLKNRRRSHDDL